MTILQHIEVMTRSVGETPRRGQILEVLGDESSRHYRVHWEDGHESILYPGAAVHIAEDDPAPRAVRGLIAILSKADVSFELLPHPRTTSADAEARALGVVAAATGKTVVITLAGERVRVVVPGSRRLSMERLEDVLGGAAKLLTEPELAEAYPMFEVGAVPPFGGPAERVIVDADVASHHSVIVEAGSHELSLRLSPRDLIAVADAEVAAVSC